MADAPKPYMVVLLFSNGLLASNATLAPSPEAAAASLAIDAIRQTGTPENLIGVAVTPLHVDFLRTALRAAEGDLSGDGKNVLSLVPAAPPVPPEFAPEPLMGEPLRYTGRFVAGAPEPEPPPAA